MLQSGVGFTAEWSDAPRDIDLPDIDVDALMGVLRNEVQSQSAEERQRIQNQQSELQSLHSELEAVRLEALRDIQKIEEQNANFAEERDDLQHELVELEEII